MKDIQNLSDERKIPIQKVGVKDIHYPITVKDRKNRIQHTTAIVNMYVDLPHNFKGTHMSRFVEILNKYHGEITFPEIKEILFSMLSKFSCESAHLELSFPYFLEKEAPVSKAKSLLDYQCALIAELKKTDVSTDFDLIVESSVPVTSLCPCSKEISSRGAHNQRSIVTIRVRAKEFIWFEELIEIAEQAASSPLYTLLKRDDEKYVTENAFDNPVFVEDLLRNIAIELRNDKRIHWFEIESENMESIHNHNAYGKIDSRLL